MKAIKFLVYTHMSLDEGLAEDRAKITQILIKKCFDLLNVDNPSPSRVKRVIEILMNII